MSDKSDIGALTAQIRTGSTENARLRRLICVARDALDAEKTPDFGIGHDRAVAALSEALSGVKPKDPYAGARSVPLDELRSTSSREKQP